MKESLKLLDVATLDFNDKKTWDLISSGQTDSVFQLESVGMKDVCMRIKPDNMESLCAILALYRPDSMAELEHYIKRKNGEEEITYLHPDLIPILEKTYGCIIYQEQTMRIAKVFAGFSDGEADDLRKGLGKKDKKKVKEQADKFYLRALEKGYEEEVCRKLADDMAEKGGYSFNKSHSYSYAVTAYKTAYLKVNYDIFYTCSLLNSSKGSYDDLSKYINMGKQLGLSILEPDINSSSNDFSIRACEILFGTEMIKNVGGASIPIIVENRPYSSFEEFNTKCNLDTRSTTSLIKSGCFNSFNRDKKELLLQYCNLLYAPNQYKEAVSLPTKKELLKLGLIADDIDFKNKTLCLLRFNSYRSNKYLESEKIRYQKHLNEFTEKYMIGDEADFQFEVLSMYLTENPYKDLEDILIPYDETDFGEAIVAGTISAIQVKTDRNSKKFGSVSILNHEGKIIEAVAWSSIYVQYQEQLKKGTKVICKGKKKESGYSIDEVKLISQWGDEVKARQLNNNAIYYKDFK